MASEKNVNRVTWACGRFSCAFKFFFCYCQLRDFIYEDHHNAEMPRQKIWSLKHQFPRKPTESTEHMCWMHVCVCECSDLYLQHAPTGRTSSQCPGVSVLSWNNCLIDSHGLQTHTTATLNTSQLIIEKKNKSHRRAAKCFWSNLKKNIWMGWTSSSCLF